MSKATLKTCAYCTLPAIQDRTIIENKLAFCFLTYQPITHWHCLISPKRHVATFDKLSKNEVDSILKLKKRVTKLLTEKFKAEGFNFAWNENKIAGQSVPHFHLHVVPRKKGDTGIYQYEPRSFLYRTDGRPITPEIELKKRARTIRSKLRG